MRRVGQAYRHWCGTAETRVAALLDDHHNRTHLPGVMWLDPVLRRPVTGLGTGTGHHLAPDIDALPLLDRRFLTQDPHHEHCRWEANMVGARGCPYNCSFYGAVVSANPDITIRTRHPDGILTEMQQLRETANVTAFRFVDDLFLGARRVIDRMMTAFTATKIRRLGGLGRHRPHQRPRAGQRRPPSTRSPATGCGKSPSASNQAASASSPASTNASHQT